MIMKKEEEEKIQYLFVTILGNYKLISQLIKKVIKTEIYGDYKILIDIFFVLTVLSMLWFELDSQLDDPSSIYCSCIHGCYKSNLILHFSWDSVSKRIWRGMSWGSASVRLNIFCLFQVSCFHFHAIRYHCCSCSGFACQVVLVWASIFELLHRFQLCTQQINVWRLLNCKKSVHPLILQNACPMRDHEELFWNYLVSVSIQTLCYRYICCNILAYMTK